MGGRDHTSHRLVALGLSERAAVLLLYLVAVAVRAAIAFVSLPDRAVPDGGADRLLRDRAGRCSASSSAASRCIPATRSVVPPGLAFVRLIERLHLHAPDRHRLHRRRADRARATTPPICCDSRAVSTPRCPPSSSRCRSCSSASSPRSRCSGSTRACGATRASATSSGWPRRRRSARIAARRRAVVPHPLRRLLAGRLRHRLAAPRRRRSGRRGSRSAPSRETLPPARARRRPARADLRRRRRRRDGGAGAVEQPRPRPGSGGLPRRRPQQASDADPASAGDRRPRRARPRRPQRPAPPR